MVWSSGTWTVKPGHEDQFAEAWREFATWSLTTFAPGTRAWLLRDRDRPGVFVTVGPWPDDEAMAAWRASAGFRERIARMRELLDAFQPNTLDEVLSVP